MEFEKPTVIRRGTQSMEQRVFGDNCPRHAITGMCLEQGSGAHPPDWQARNQHIPHIRQTQGDKVAEAMLLKMDHIAKKNAKAWEEWRANEIAKLEQEDI